jgi:hypothetical protein
MGTLGELPLDLRVGKDRKPIAERAQLRCPFAGKSAGPIGGVSARLRATGSLRCSSR